MLAGLGRARGLKGGANGRNCGTDATTVAAATPGTSGAPVVRASRAAAEKHAAPSLRQVAAVSDPEPERLRVAAAGLGMEGDGDSGVAGCMTGSMGGGSNRDPLTGANDQGGFVADMEGGGKSGGRQQRRIREARRREAEARRAAHSGAELLVKAAVQDLVRAEFGLARMQSRLAFWCRVQSVCILRAAKTVQRAARAWAVRRGEAAAVIQTAVRSRQRELQRERLQQAPIADDVVGSARVREALESAMAVLQLEELWRAGHGMKGEYAASTGAAEGRRERWSRGGSRGARRASLQCAAVKGGRSFEERFGGSRAEFLAGTLELRKAVRGAEAAAPVREKFGRGRRNGARDVASRR